MDDDVYHDLVSLMGERAARQVCDRPAGPDDDETKTWA